MKRQSWDAWHGIENIEIVEPPVTVQPASSAVQHIACRAVEQTVTIVGDGGEPTRTTKVMVGIPNEHWTHIIA